MSGTRHGQQRQAHPGSGSVTSETRSAVTKISLSGNVRFCNCNWGSGAPSTPSWPRDLLLVPCVGHCFPFPFRVQGPLHVALHSTKRGRWVWDTRGSVITLIVVCGSVIAVDDWEW